MLCSPHVCSRLLLFMRFPSFCSNAYPNLFSHAHGTAVCCFVSALCPSAAGSLLAVGEALRRSLQVNHGTFGARFGLLVSLGSRCELPVFFPLLCGEGGSPGCFPPQKSLSVHPQQNEGRKKGQENKLCSAPLSTAPDKHLRLHSDVWLVVLTTCLLFLALSNPVVN